MASDATALAAAIRRGQLTAGAAMDASLAMADLWSHSGRDLGAICYMNRARGRLAAEEFDALPSGAPRRYAAFGGVPTLAKDLGAPFAGFPAVAGSALFARRGLGTDSDLAHRFREAGLCPFGLTTSPEFGLSLTCEPVIGPHCRNPLAPELSPGGSSGGAAAAVAAGIVAIAHATDAGGSIRVPAAACGLVGLKPGRGSIPGGPDFANHLGGLASELAVCRSVRDAGALFAACATGETRGPIPAPLLTDAPEGPLRIGLMAETGSDWPTDPERAEAVDEAALLLARNGHRIVTLDWALLADQVRLSAEIFADLICANLATLEAGGLDLSGAEPMTQAAARRGAALSGPQLWARMDQMVRVSRDLWSVFEGIDALLTPMLATAPLPLGSMPTNHGDTALHFHRMQSFAPMAALANVSGFPALTLPFGQDEDGLPLPVQLIAPLGAERLLLQLATRLEIEERWTHLHPLAGLA